jgi:DNA-directed RNA polymerase subunit RPC12/RpoP
MSQIFMPRGGYREGSGRSKQGHYKGIYCGSTYELCWAIHALDHGIKFTRFPGQLKKDKLIYIPDFLLADEKTIIEPKGYDKGDSVTKKTALAESLGYIVKVLKKDDLKYAFDYVEKTYNTKHFHTLYDDYKPKYTYVCSFCNKEFSRDKKLKNNCKEAFCNQSCSGKKRLLQNKDKPNSGQFGKRIDSASKLTKEQALYIYYATNKTSKELAKEFNINQSAVWFVKQKKTYKWIHEGISDSFIPKTYGSITNYKIEKRKEIEEIIQKIIKKFGKDKLVFKNIKEIVAYISHIANDKYSKKIAASTIKTKPYYRVLVDNYLQEQSNF